MRLTLAMVLGILSAFATPALAGATLFQLDQKSYTESDLSPASRQTLFEIESERYQKTQQLIETAAIDAWAAAEAKRTGKTAEKVMEEKFKASPATEAQIKAFYNENKQRIPAPLDQIKPQIAQLLQERAAGEKRAKFVAELRAKKQLSSSLVEPVAPQFEINTEGFAAVGPAKGKSTVVVFTDYKCPHCKHLNDAFKPVIKRFREQVRFVFPDFPLREGGPSELLAIGGQCAHEQKKFLEFHDLVFDKLNDAKMVTPEDFAKALKLDEKQFQACLSGSSAKSLVARGRAEGERLGVSGTPTIFINGRRAMVRPETMAISAEIQKSLK
jgi:protein-disulfide isomerase